MLTWEMRIINIIKVCLFSFLLLMTKSNGTYKIYDKLSNILTYIVFFTNRRFMIWVYNFTWPPPPTPVPGDPYHMETKADGAQSMEPSL